MPKSPLKAELIRSLPRDMPLQKVQQAARRAGLGKLAKSYVAKVRSGMPRTNGHAAKERAADVVAPDDVPTSYGDLSILPVPASVVQATRQPGLPASETELRFFSMLVQIGTRRAYELLKAYEGL